jgi:hypothetical protein
MSTPLLSIQDLKVAFRMGKQGGVVAQAVKGVSFDIPRTPPWRWWASRARARASPRCPS